MKKKTNTNKKHDQILTIDELTAKSISINKFYINSRVISCGEFLFVCLINGKHGGDNYQS